ncbi:cytochrome c biogenesis heme-transporting ATPase CcmA [Legionella sp. km772]|uniref:cytochrome c biogenesis heme-transporting ATPase CcmA n=1 Tax=Legionella sp. km772 TaxID=2498111 RepID=UPI000F8C8D81|nr:cytochrome c biogenesis heme-transporting ATPase CcmA [Legionella sp. km772]RUR13300.1 cytochrome c biogenesis heme-transporting ATPase CcmA [Legionella sp. km772]
MPLLQLIDLAFDYQERPLLHHINFTLQRGDLLHIHGANGAGKTTLLKILAGLYRPSLGLVKYQDQEIYNDLAAYQRELCVIGHQTGISPYLTIKENCLFDSHFSKGFNIDELVSIFNLGRYLNTACGLLSAGQRRQVGLLRLWMSQATLWLLDEPFVALDEQALTVLMDKIRGHREEGGAVILTSHQPLALEKGSYKDYFL